MNPNPSWTEVCQAVASLAGVVLSLVGFLFVILQLRQNQQATDRQTHAIVYQLNQEIYSLLVNHPDLRPYFYENEKIPCDEPIRSKVLAAAEMICDMFEYIVLNDKSLGKEIRKGWMSYMRRMYQENQCLPEFLSIASAQYSDDFLSVLGHKQRRYSHLESKN
jgi:hypothetical protein